MIKDLLGNDLKEGDLVVLKITEISIGRITLINEGGVIAANTKGALSMPGKIVIQVEAHRIFDSNTGQTDLVKVVEPSKTKVN